MKRLNEIRFLFSSDWHSMIHSIMSLNEWPYEKGSCAKIIVQNMPFFSLYDFHVKWGHHLITPPCMCRKVNGLLFQTWFCGCLENYACHKTGFTETIKSRERVEIGSIKISKYVTLFQVFATKLVVNMK